MGSPIPQLHMRVIIITRTEVLCPGNFMLATKGSAILAVTLWLMIVASTRTTADRKRVTSHICQPAVILVTALPIVSSSPEFLHALPKAIPPIARKTTFHEKWLKSCLVSVPAKKNKNMGINETVPIPPTVETYRGSRHQRITVRIVTPRT